MVWSNVPVCAWLELAVMIFQVFGVAALYLNRLMPSTRLGRIGAGSGFIVAVFGLGLTGEVTPEASTRNSPSLLAGP